MKIIEKHFQACQENLKMHKQAFYYRSLLPDVKRIQIFQPSFQKSKSEFKKYFKATDDIYVYCNLRVSKEWFGYFKDEFIPTDIPGIKPDISTRPSVMPSTQAKLKKCEIDFFGDIKYIQKPLEDFSNFKLFVSSHPTLKLETLSIK
ncbi:hypothetical protein RF11_07055 [Thelohanellus kitauei]|uniref:Uncharacterized protein n=1 Tax=Thelohanellus kitauei TaxID=669202 RepID=A0A0C2N804_THEKT|nr:hypothetical protein RF11_07055 [Thelohanellus kitauei]